MKKFHDQDLNGSSHASQGEGLVEGELFDAARKGKRIATWRVEISKRKNQVPSKSIRDCDKRNCRERG